MYPLDVRWTEGATIRRRKVTNAADGMRLFKQIRARSAQSPTMVEFANDDRGLALAIGVGRPQTVLTFQVSGDPPYFTSRGITEASGEDLYFTYAGEGTPYPSNSAVPIDDGILVLRDFLESGERSDAIAWERL